MKPSKTNKKVSGLGDLRSPQLPVPGQTHHQSRAPISHARPATQWFSPDSSITLPSDHGKKR